MDLSSFMRNYLTELEETQKFLSLYCKNIQTSIQELELKKEELMKPPPEVKEEKVLDDHQMSEIDILLEKAQKVFIDIDSVKETKAKPTKTGESVSKFKSTTSKVNTGQKSSRLPSKSTAQAKRHLANEKAAAKKKEEVHFLLNNNVKEPLKKCSHPTGLDQTNTTMLHRNDSSVPDSEEATQFSPLFDDNFKEEYCHYHKLKRELSKSQHDKELLRMNRSVKEDFVASIKPSPDMDKISSIVLDNVEQLVTQYHDILMNCEKLKSDSTKVIKLYQNEQQQGTHLTKAQVESHSKLMQAKFKIIFQQKLKALLSSHFSEENELTVLHYRQLYSLLTTRSGFPSLLKH